MLSRRARRATAARAERGITEHERACRSFSGGGSKGSGRRSHPVKRGSTMSSSSATADAIAPNAQRLLGAGFLAILATGIGFAIRGGILATWAAEFGFTGAQLGAIGGAGLTGFCFGVIIGGLVVDKVGYGRLIVAAFVMHLLSALVTFAATKGQAQDTAYMFLPRHVHSARERHARSGRQPARVDALPAQPHALPQHPARELARRPRPRRSRRVDSRRGHAGELEDSARPVPRADDPLRLRILRSVVPQVRSARKGLERGR